MSTTPDLTTTPFLDRRARISAAVDRYAAVIASDQCACPTHDELTALALLCDAHFLYVEARRVRGWLEREA